MLYCTKMALAAVLTLGLVGLVQADQKPANPAAPPAGAAKTTPGTLTEEQLGQMLEGMGFEVKPGTYTGGARYFDIRITSNGMDFTIRVALSPNKRVIWLMSYLGDLPADVTVAQLKDLLQAINTKTGKMQFRLTGTQLKADQPLDNVGVTAARLRREIDDFTASLGDTASLWGFKKTEKTEKTTKTEAK
jgi:hypothetical protein